jgi:hypothetical protein
MTLHKAPASTAGITAQYSYYYLAAVDVSVPVMNGNVTAKVRRVFEKKVDNAWGYALFYMSDLELHPSAALTINGPVMTNSNLYISTSLFTATNQYDSANLLSAVGKVSFAGDYVNSFAPYDARSGNGTSTSAPNFVAGMPPVQEGALLPFGWDVTTDSNAGTSANNDNYREIIEIPVTGADAFSSYRYYNQADIRVLIDASNNVTITAQQYNADGTRRTNADGSPMHVTCLANSSNTSPNFNQNVFTMINAALTRNIAFADYREATFVRVANLDISRLKTDIEARKMSPFFTGVIYITDTSTNGATISAPLGGSGATQGTTERGIRLVSGASLPSTSSTGTYYGITVNGVFTPSWLGGLTIVSGNPVYIRGDYNTGSGTIPSNAVTTPDFSKPNVASYTRQPSAVMGDSINVQSALWSDANVLTTAIAQRTTQNTTINTALLAGNVLATSSAAYSGGGENFIRLNEDWSGKNLTYYGSAVQLFQSIQGARTYTSASSIFRSPTLRWYWDPVLGKLIRPET